MLRIGARMPSSLGGWEAGGEKESHGGGVSDTGLRRQAHTRLAARPWAREGRLLPKMALLSGGSWRADVFLEPHRFEVSWCLKATLQGEKCLKPKARVGLRSGSSCLPSPLPS